MLLLIFKYYIVMIYIKQKRFMGWKKEKKKKKYIQSCSLEYRERARSIGCFISSLLSRWHSVWKHIVCSYYYHNYYFCSYSLSSYHRLLLHPCISHTSLAFPSIGREVQSNTSLTFI